MQKWMRDSFETERLVINEGTLSDLIRLDAICKSWEDKTWIEGDAFSDYIKSCLETGDLPPSPLATKENYRLKKIEMKDSDNIIGYYGDSILSDSTFAILGLEVDL